MIRTFLEIISSWVRHFPDSSAARQTFSCTGAGFVRSPTEFLIIIGGLAGFGAKPYRSFFEILSNMIEHF